jgi:ABC-type multidrug transport system fused ATPase/permease subunit
MRRLDSVTRSPLYNLYGETLGGIAVIRAFGAASTTLSSMFRAINTNVVTSYWMVSAHRCRPTLTDRLTKETPPAVYDQPLAVGEDEPALIRCPRCRRMRSDRLGLDCGHRRLCSGSVFPELLARLRSADHSYPFHRSAFANSVSHNCQFVVRRWTSTVQSMVAVERVKAYSELPLEAAEFVEPRPPASWPTSGQIDVEDLEIKYAPELPTVLHKVSFSVEAGTRVAIVGSTGSGKVSGCVVSFPIDLV